MELTVDQALQRGISAHKDGKLQDAERLYRAILQVQPEHADANHNLGVLAVSVGKPSEALPFLKLALETNPRIEQFWLSYVDTLIRLERFDEANRVLVEGEKAGVSPLKLSELSELLPGNEHEDGHETAREESLKKRKTRGSLSTTAPSQAQIHLLMSYYNTNRLLEAEELALSLTKQFRGHAFSWKVLGAIIKQTGRLDESLAPMQRAVEISPKDPETHNNLGVTLQELGRLREAEDSYQRALALKPDVAEAHYNLGNTLNGLGRLDEAVVSHNCALALKPDFAEAHYNLGNTLKALGRLDQAEASFRRAIELKPEFASAHSNLGVTLTGLGRFKDAEASHRKAIEVMPDFAEAHSNRGNTLRELGRLKESEASYRKAISLKSDFAEAHCNLGVTLHELGRLHEAEASYNRALMLMPESAVAHNNLGVTLKELRKLEEAKASYNAALVLNPDFTEAYNNLGVTLKALGSLAEAETNYRKAISLKPDYAEAHSNLGITLLELLRLDETIESCSKAIALKPDLADAHVILGKAIGKAIFTESNPQLYPPLLQMLTGGEFVRPSDAAAGILSLLKQDPVIKNLLLQNLVEMSFEQVGRAIESLHELPLLHHLMRVCPLPDLQLEGLFLTVRRLLLANLNNFETSPERVYFLSTLSLHCFVNEYIYAESDEEIGLIADLEDEIRQTVMRARQPDVLKVLCLASYRPLHKYDWHKTIETLDNLREVRKRLLDDPLTEKSLAETIPVLAEISDSVSQQVRSQYEENPYPRWIKTEIHAKSKSISAVCDEASLSIHSQTVKSVAAPKILVAGCGTGQHSIGTASRFSNCHVTAVDLSLASLAYAQRKTTEFGLSNLRYLQADILHLDALGQEFDIIESSGVLHHMNEPMAGWRILVDQLKPGGLMRIGLYSELARRHIERVRQQTASLRTESSEAAIKQFRRSLVESDDDSAQRLSMFGDFFSLSTFRDLVFHVQEHCFTLPKIRSSLDELGLHFCGFENPDTVKHFLKFFGRGVDTYDLSLWHEFEQSNPRAFIGMYQFWCQKI